MGCVDCGKSETARRRPDPGGVPGFGHLLRAAAGYVNTELHYAGLERRPFDSQALRGAIGTGDSPTGFFERGENLLAPHVVEHGAHVARAIAQTIGGTGWPGVPAG